MTFLPTGPSGPHFNDHFVDRSLRAPRSGVQNIFNSKCFTKVHVKTRRSHNLVNMGLGA